jgi:NAD+ diphosphatase
MTFTKELHKPDIKNETSYWFIFTGSKLLVTCCDNDRYTIPVLATPEMAGVSCVRTQYLGRYNDIPCFSAEAEYDAKLPVDMTRFNLRDLFTKLDPDLLNIAFYAIQIVAWDRDFQFCGRCSAKTKNMENERAKICEKCNLISYPRISPAIIVAIVRDDKILLSRSKRFRHMNMFSVLAGFVEPGESLEECVVREVREEVGIAVKNIRYFGSQSWPFPDALMVAFTAEYAGGEIAIDGDELVEAGWFSASQLPQIPGKFSIARKLIDWFIEKEAGRNKS